MIVELITNISAESRKQVEEVLVSKGFAVNEVKTQKGLYIVAIGRSDIDIRAVGHLKGVKDVYRVSDEYKLVSRKWKVSPTVINLNDGDTITEGQLAIIAGPCSIESESQVKSILSHMSKNNVKIFRGGAFKPRTSPYAFRGLGIDGLKLVHEQAKKLGIKIISEVMEISQIEPMYDYIDIYQVGTRNTQNFNLLHELGKVDKPVLVKRGMSGTLEELLQSAEYIFASGNEQLILCERGVRSFEKAYRNMLDLNAVPVLKEKSHLPVIVDPSHGIGIRRFVEPVSLAAIMAGADGIMFEVHEKPEEAWSDGAQTLNFVESTQLIEKARKTFNLRESLEENAAEDPLK